MRIRRLTLERYGGWADRDLELGAGLTIVSGPNEAGKSTLLDALSDLLWGIPRPVRHAWAFSPSRLALCARVEVDGRDVTVRRTTRGLADGDGGTLEAPWGPGGMDARKRWRQGFGLGHEELREGGRRLCDGGGDLAELVFTARSGRDVRAVVGALDSEADKLFREHRGSKSVEVRAAMGRYERTEEQVAEQMARAGEVTALVDEIARQERRATELARSKTAAVRDSDHARQTLRAHDPARTLAALRVERAALEASGAVLDAGRLDEYREASDALTTADDDVAAHRHRADELRGRRAELDVDEVLLVDAARIRELQAAAQARDADAERAAALRAESAQLHRRAETALSALVAPDGRDGAGRLAAVHLPADRSRDLDGLADAVRAAEQDREHAERAHRAALAEVRDVADGAGGLDLDRVARVAEVRRAIEADGSAAAQWRTTIADRATARARRDDALAVAGWLPPVRPAPAPRRPRRPAADELTLWPAEDAPAVDAEPAAGYAPSDGGGGPAAPESAEPGGSAEADHPRIAVPPTREMRRLRSALRDAVQESSAALRDADTSRDRVRTATTARDAVADDGRPVGPDTLAAARADRDARVADLLDALRAAAPGGTHAPEAPRHAPDGARVPPGAAEPDDTRAPYAPRHAPDGARVPPGAAEPDDTRAPYAPRDASDGARVPDGGAGIAAAAARAERAIGAADRVADDMIDSADRVAELAHRESELAAARDALAAAEDAVRTAERAHRDADAVWAALWRAHGVATPDPDDADAVGASLADAAREHAEVLRADERLAGLYEQTRAQEGALATALSRAGRPREGAGLDVLLVAAADLAAEADRVHDRRVLLARLRTDADRAGGAADAARHEADAAGLRWRHGLRAAGLPVDLEPAGWATRRDTVGEAQQAGRGAARADTEADRLDDAVRTHRDAVAELVAAHLPPTPADPQTRLPELAERVRAASEAAVSSAHLDDAVAEAERDAARAVRATQTARSVLDRLAVELALTETLDEGGLEAAAERGERAALTDARIDETRRLIAAAAPDLDVEQLVAAAPETEAGALDEHRARCEETERELETAHADVIEQLGGLRARRRELEGADQAATLHAEAQEHLARAADAAERYLVVHLQREILRRELDTYERTHASPLLVGAGALVERLTGGRFVALRPPAEGGRRLVAVRADGEEMDPSRLSEGTADQVHLALRLAGIEQLQSDRVAAGLPTVPVVLDDVLMTFDDERAVAATAVLTDLAQRFQVLLFTHHDHLVTLARQAGHEFALAELPAPAAVEDPVDADAARAVPVG